MLDQCSFLEGESKLECGKGKGRCHSLFEGLISWVKVETFPYNFTHKSRFFAKQNCAVLSKFELI